jgi:hypothetical protein
MRRFFFSFVVLVGGCFVNGVGRASANLQLVLSRRVERYHLTVLHSSTVVVLTVSTVS